MAALNRCIFLKIWLSVHQLVLKLAFGSHCSANFQSILDCFIPNFKLKHEDSENIKADRASTVVSNFRQIKRRAFLGHPVYTFLFINYMIRLEIGLKIRHRGVMSLCAIEDKTAVVVVASYRSVSRNPVRFKALIIEIHPRIVLRQGNVPGGPEVVSKWVKADLTDLNTYLGKWILNATILLIRCK